MFKVGQRVRIFNCGTPLDTSNRPVFITKIGSKWITTSEGIKVSKNGAGPWSITQA